MRGRAPRLLAALTAAFCCARAGAASFPPEWRFRTLRGPRVSVHFPAALEPAARRAATLAEEILARHEARYAVRLKHLQLVLEDTADDPNGFATPFPYPLVQIRSAAPDGSDGFGSHDGWLRLVLTHELAHAVHLEPARGILGFGRKLFGRAPPLFPNSLTPTWLIEGLATYEETEAGAFGRGRNPDSRMVLRMAALERRFPRVDQAVLGLDAWPAGQTAYLFGEAFLRALSEEHGPGTLPALARRQLLPFADDLAAVKVTGAPFYARWARWAAALRGAFQLEAEDRGSEGLTASPALTTRGIRQTGARFSRDGTRLAYTSSSLSRYRQIRLIDASGANDRALVLRNDGSSLAFSPDGRTLVYDESDSYRLFRSLSDLKAVDVSSGRVRRLTHGLRARDPDVSPDGSSVAFVQRLEGRSELALLALDGSRRSLLTRSPRDTEWSGPRFSPDGRTLAASRLAPGGFLDLVLVDVASGALTPLTRDRAKDVEPSWLPDGSGIVFRSDRDGVSNLYLLRLADSRLLRVSNVLGGAFAPDVASDGRRVAFSNYSSRGYDIHLLELDAERLAPAPPFVDAAPPSAAPPEPAAGEARPYRPYPTALPRFWLPYLTTEERGARLGAVTAGADPLRRHVYGLELRYATGPGRGGYQGFYQYDRFLPTLLLNAEDVTRGGALADLRRRQLAVQVAWPLARTLRSSHAVSFAWRREREEERGAAADPALDKGGLEAAYTFTNARRYAYSISPVDGWRVRLALLREARALGSDVSLAKWSADARGYVGVGGGTTLALRTGGGGTLGQRGFRRSFSVGGFADDTLRDVVATNLSLLRGYPDEAFAGRNYFAANLELRVPLAHPQRGLRTLPVFLRHMHAAAFVDAGDAWSGGLRAASLKTGFGAALGADLNLSHAVPFTFTAGVARGLADGGDTRLYIRSGLSF
jgi:hypothetical protein